MFLRKIEKSLLEWKNSLKIRKSAFILKGSETEMYILISK